jgi:hypothetical protein
MRRAEADEARELRNVQRFIKMRENIFFQSSQLVFFEQGTALHFPASAVCGVACMSSIR